MSPNQGWVEPPPQQPGYAPHQQGVLTCPKCRGQMRTYERNGIHIEQCSGCRGIFLDFGELEHIVRLEGQISAHPAPPPVAGHYGPGWGHHGGYRYRKQGLGRLFFSS
jgi:Zn-finger nucleic acid-binding protein